MRACVYNVQTSYVYLRVFSVLNGQTEGELKNKIILIPTKGGLERTSALLFFFFTMLTTNAHKKIQTYCIAR